MSKEELTVVASNKKAFHDYAVEERVEAGIALTGTEVKSLREGRANLKDSYAMIKEGEAFIIGFHIPPYSHGNIMNVDPERIRKLLLHRSEIRTLTGKLTRQGYTLVPLRVYFRRGKAKLELGLAKGKRLYDVRQTIKEKEAKREVERAMKSRKAGE